MGASFPSTGLIFGIPISGTGAIFGNREIFQLFFTRANTVLVGIRFVALVALRDRSDQESAFAP